MKQDVATEEYPVGSVQQADVIVSLARRVDYLQFPVSKMDSVTIRQPMADLER